MNTVAQLCGMAILAIILFFYLRSPKVDFKSGKFFSMLLIIDVICLYLDVASIYGIVFQDRLPVFVTSLFCRLYLDTLVYTTYIGFCYILSLADVSEKEIKRIGIINFFILTFGIVLIAVLPISWYTKGMVTYSYGPACTAAFVFAPYFMLSTVAYATIRRKQFRTNVLATVYIWIGFQCAAALIQLLFPRMLMVGFATVIGLTVIFNELENPALQIDRMTGAFNVNTLSRYIQDFYNRNASFSYVIIKLVYEGNSVTEGKNGIFYRTAQLLKKQRGAKLFFTGQSSFVLIYKNVSEAEAGSIFINTELAELCREVNSGFLEIYEPEGRKAKSLVEILELANEISVNGEYADRRIITLHDEDYERFRQQRRVIKEIDRALDEDRVEAYFQPIYSFEEQKFTVAEALVRIRQEDGDIMSPGLFIPIAEKTGQVTKIGDRMFMKTLELIRDERVKDLGVDFIDVNLSVLQCEDETLATRYLNLMRKYGVSPSMFCFEITESAMIVNRDHLLANMNAFREAGSSVSLDDFGNGESNLNYVIDMPIDLIKADRSMVSNYRMNHRVGLIMDSMIHMAKGLSLKIVAEGVETEDDLKAMRDLDIDYIQGFYFSKPLPRRDYVKFIRKNNKMSA